MATSGTAPTVCWPSSTSAAARSSQRRWINERKADSKPFVWTKTADQVLDTLAAYCQRITDS